ncbi:efflux RND transporter periplasmic adaptor subunit [Chitinivorax sp. PXF-14]|uniref:efflux RND transporter periplasmic adaptor subunit n=1 Tax=Chitinivorax sp. PXF-14 TaxID=3230488 RepID=UPI003467313B
MTPILKKPALCLALVLGVQPLSAGAAPLMAATVDYRQVPLTYASEGTVEAIKQSTVAAQIGGRVMEVNFKVGDYVKAGQVLVRIDPRETGQALAASQSQVAQVKAALDEAKLQYERQQQLFAQKFISQAALDSAQAAYKAAQAAYAAALAGSGAAATTHSFATVIAPYAGVVSAVQVEVGDTTFPGKPLMSGFDPADLRVVATLPQAKWDAVRGGAGAKVEIPALNRWLVPTHVTVLPVADARRHTAQVRLDLPADTRNVVPGMFARAHFVTGEARKLLVPAAAVLRRSELTAVYVIGPGERTALRQVRLGDAAGEAGIEVLAGLKAGERVALEPVKAGLAR